MTLINILFYYLLKLLVTFIHLQIFFWKIPNHNSLNNFTKNTLMMMIFPNATNSYLVDEQKMESKHISAHCDLCTNMQYLWAIHKPCGQFLLFLTPIPFLDYFTWLSCRWWVKNGIKAHISTLWFMYKNAVKVGHP